MTPQPWPKDRREELVELIDLLADARSINSGSHVIEKLQRIQAAADRLTSTDYATPRASFQDYLCGLARAQPPIPFVSTKP